MSDRLWMPELALGRLAEFVSPRSLDQIIGFVSPAAEARRIKARIASHQLRKIETKVTRAGGYDGGSRGRRTDSWHTPMLSADATVAGNLALIRARSRDLVRNNGWAERGIRTIAAKTIGCGIIPEATSGSSRRTRAFEDLLKAWADEPICDVTGAHDFYGLQAQVSRAVAQDGDVLVRRVIRPTTPGLPPLQLQVLEADYLDTSRDSFVFQGNRVIQGVEIDAYGAPVAYYLFSEHPGAAGYMRGLTSKRVPATEVQLVRRIDRAGQIRGVPWLAPVILRLKDLDDYEDAQLVRQKIAACFTGFIRDTEGLDTNEDQSTIDDMSRFEPGMFEILPPGKDITFATPPPADGYSEHTRAQLRAIAAALGITYEALTGDLSQVNFSSARMGWLDMNENIRQWQQQMIIPQFCKVVFRWLVEVAELSNLAQGPVTATWTPPRREMIDPIKETEALKQQVRNGFKSLSEAVREGGRDFENVVAENEAAFKMLDDKGFTYDCDPRRSEKAPSTGGAAPAPQEPAA